MDERTRLSEAFINALKLVKILFVHMIIMFQKLQLQMGCWKREKTHRTYKQRLEEEKEEAERRREN